MRVARSGGVRPSLAQRKRSGGQTKTALSAIHRVAQRSGGQTKTALSAIHRVAQRSGGQNRRDQSACKPGSVHRVSPDWQPFLWEGLCRPPRATHPGRGAENGPQKRPLFGLAPGGVYHAGSVAGPAVGSYPTLSPLPRIAPGRSALCGTFPRLTPGGRYPPPCLHGARTFLQQSKNRQRLPGRLVLRPYIALEAW